ncbi:hypothetical protein [Chitinophaga ginsengisegetis]|uniref:hypothetical protein n=1 Tax=Chitinophaga ginsengisegetis TaxID=393003 RepID=UPI000DBFC95C|nr:hypothetical protein [Chitinophaga ginsengisegetis]MDR6570643.1 hypothetical protein [Chitinophaga ginsengisegetis]MDR6650377.1 hypothetical protein [Chitinophaga ginsengisegetis]MDR6656504.1 hypothetical protein [Chitinophaga ginsengisegetis]
MRHLFKLCLLLSVYLPAMAQKPANELHFTSSQQQLITVYKGTIFVNGNKAFVLHEDIINYKSKRNRLVENGKSVFLFLEVNGSPNKNRLYVFNIDHSLADSLLSAVSSDVKDWDRDGNLEFGGSDVTKPYPAADSMYYVPSKFYEIKRGKITYDAELTETTDKKVNGIFLAAPLNSSSTVIPKPKKRY